MKQNKVTSIIALVVGVVMVCTQTASADVTVVYKINASNGGGTQTIRYADKQHVRLDMGSVGNRKMSMLKLGDKVYSITGKVVQDMSQLSAMMASMGLEKKKSHKAQVPIKFEDTGKTETIAGLLGKVYRFEEKGRSHEVVLADNKDLHAAVSAAMAITRAVADMMPSGPENRIQQNAAIKNMAILRLDNTMHIQLLNNATIPAAIFKLPSAPQKMGGLGRLMKSALGR